LKEYQRGEGRKEKVVLRKRSILQQKVAETNPKINMSQAIEERVITMYTLNFNK